MCVHVFVDVCRYYSDIHSAASGCYQEMNSTLTELSGVSNYTYHIHIPKNYRFSVGPALATFGCSDPSVVMKMF